MFIKSILIFALLSIVSLNAEDSIERIEKEISLTISSHQFVNFEKQFEKLLKGEEIDRDYESYLEKLSSKNDSLELQDIAALVVKIMAEKSKL